MNGRLGRIGVWATAALVGGVALVARAGDWPMLGREPGRNAVSPERDAPDDWDVGDPEKAGDGRNIVWEANLGSESYGNPVIVDGVVWVGTNNESKFDPQFQKDGGVLAAFRARDGKFLWQRYTPKLPSGRVNDWPLQGICSSPLVEDGRLWYCTSRCEVVCLDVRPLRGGGGADAGAPKELWSLDMMGRLGVFPHNMTACSPVAHGKLLYVITANGVDDTHRRIPAPLAPSIVCLNRDTGAVVWSANTPGEGILHAQWSSPAVVEVDGKAQVIAPLGDGWIYAYDALSGAVVWRFDTNPKAAIYPTTRNELIACPTIYKGRMYIANGQDPEHGEGVGNLWCVDITKAAGDVSAELPGEVIPEAAAKQREVGLMADGVAKPRLGKPNPNSAVVWHYAKHGKPDKRGRIKRAQRMNRTISTAVVAGGLVFVPDFSGFLHCLDAETGVHQWTYNMEAAVWGSPLVVDGKVYLCDEDGDVAIFAVSRELEQIGGDEALTNRSLGQTLHTSPVFANGVLYLMRRDRLFAISHPWRGAGRVGQLANRRDNGPAQNRVFLER